MGVTVRMPELITVVKAVLTNWSLPGGVTVTITLLPVVTGAVTFWLNVTMTPRSLVMVKVQTLSVTESQL